MNEETKPKKPIWKKWWLWIGAFFVIIIIASSAGENNKENPPGIPSSNQVAQQEEKAALLWGKENGEIVVPLINIFKYSPCDKPWPEAQYPGEWGVAQLPHETEVTIIEEMTKDDNTCYKVKLSDNKEGWVSSSLIKLK